MKYNFLEDSSGDKLKLLPIGTKVRHKKYPKLIGQIVHYEYHECGKVSPLPYCVHWDNNSLASKLLGWFFIYPCRNELQYIREESNG